MKRPRRGVRRFVFASRSRSRRVVVVCTCTRTNVQTYSCSTRQSDVDRRAPLLFRPFPRESSIASRNRGTSRRPGVLALSHPRRQPRVPAPVRRSTRDRRRRAARVLRVLLSRRLRPSPRVSTRWSPPRRPPPLRRAPPPPPIPISVSTRRRASGARRRSARTDARKLERVPGARSTRDAGRDSERRRVSSAPLRSSRGSGRRRRRR